MTRIPDLATWVDSPHWRAFTRAVAAGMDADGLRTWAESRRLDISSRLLTSGLGIAQAGLRSGERLAEIPLGERMPRADWARNRAIPSAYQVTLEMIRTDAETGDEIVHYHTMDFARNPTAGDIWGATRLELERRIEAGYYPYEDGDVSDWVVTVHTAYRRSAL